MLKKLANAYTVEKLFNSFSVNAVFESTLKSAWKLLGTINQKSFFSLFTH